MAAAVAAVGEVEVAVPVNIAGLGVGAFHLPHLPLIDDDAKVAEIVEITGGSHHRVDAFRHFRGVKLGRRTVFAAGQMPPELGRMVDLHLGEGVYGAVVNLFPCDSEYGVVQIIVDKTALKQLHVGAEIQLLPVQKKGRFVQKPLQGRRIVGLTVAVRVRLRGDLRVVRNLDDDLFPHGDGGFGNVLRRLRGGKRIPGGVHFGGNKAVKLLHDRHVRGRRLCRGFGMTDGLNHFPQQNGCQRQRNRHHDDSQQDEKRTDPVLFSGKFRLICHVRPPYAAPEMICSSA